MRIPASLKFLAVACAIATSGQAAPELKKTDVTIVTALAANETLGRSLTVSINDIGNDTLAKRIEKKVQQEAAKAGFARVCIVQVDRDGIEMPAGNAGTRLSGMVMMPDGSSFSAPSAGRGFKLHRVSGELVVREVIPKTTR